MVLPIYKKTQISRHRLKNIYFLKSFTVHEHMGFTFYQIQNASKNKRY